MIPDVEDLSLGYQNAKKYLPDLYVWPKWHDTD